MIDNSDITACFAENYTQARSRFLSACNTAGADVRAYVNPELGPRDEELATDVAWIGPNDARLVLVSISATHGVEGFAAPRLRRIG